MSLKAKAWSALLQKEKLCRAKTSSNVTFLQDETKTSEGKDNVQFWNMTTSHENQEKATVPLTNQI